MVISMDIVILPFQEEGTEVTVFIAVTGIIGVGAEELFLYYFPILSGIYLFKVSIFGCFYNIF
jgi:UPF0716 family protein affecting phage T7 exclusion